jgi:MHS family alpha-ketoglutarate permease-like MFS transporter
MLLFSGLGMVMIVPLMTAIGTTTDPVLSLKRYFGM